MTDESATGDTPVRVLLVEDSPTQAEATGTILEQSGYEIEIARDGAAGLAAAERSEFDIVITDVVMPGMDGYELCRRLKALRGPDLPVILLTSLTEPMDVIRGLECGADNFVTKPYDPASLRARIAALLESRRLRTGAHMRIGIDVAFLGRRFTITSDREQVLDMLMSTFEDAVHTNDRLRQRERELADANALLEERTGAVEQASRAKSEFLANMSHELRTPLNAVLGFTDLLEEQLSVGLSPAQQRYFRNIKDAGGHLLDLINEVLDISKVEAGRLELRPDSISLDSLAEPTVASAREDASASGIAFDVEVQSDAEVRVDAGRMRQVLYNLLSNAVKFTGRGGSVQLRVALDERAMLIEVSDTGIGIPAAQRGRIFGTFERLHEGRSEATGTGLGLALTKHLVELHGGTIGFESEEGRGTTFRVRIPSVQASPMTGARLLVVEDVIGDAELIAAVAAGVGLRTEIVGSVLGAREAIRRDPPTAVVLDLRLPDERGERLLEELKADPSTRSIPMVVVTIEDDEGTSRSLGADDHITKPIDRERLAAWLRGVAARDQVTPSA